MCEHCDVIGTKTQAFLKDYVTVDKIEKVNAENRPITCFFAESVI